MSLEVGLKIRLILFWRFPCSSPRSGLSRIKMDVLRTCSPPENFTVPSALGYDFYSLALTLPLHWVFFGNFRCVHLFQFLNVCNHYVSFQIPPACNAHPRNILGKAFGRTAAVATRLLAEIGWYSTIAPNGTTELNRLAQGVFPSDKRSCFADSSSIPWNLPTNFHPDQTVAILLTYLPCFRALSSRQSHLFLICVV